jgi:hypothetical protein
MDVPADYALKTRTPELLVLDLSIKEECLNRVIPLGGTACPDSDARVRRALPPRTQSSGRCAILSYQRMAKLIYSGIMTCPSIAIVDARSRILISLTRFPAAEHGAIGHRPKCSTTFVRRASVAVEKWSLLGILRKRSDRAPEHVTARLWRGETGNSNVRGTCESDH